MTIQTKSMFYYVDPVDLTNLNLDLDDNAVEVTAEVDVGSYAPTELMTAVQEAMNLVGIQEYTVSFDRTTRLVTISAAGNFDLLFGSGSNASTSIASLLGFPAVDQTGTNSYTGTTAIGTAYRPQFPLQDYVDFEDFQNNVGASVNESGSGKVEVVTFGLIEFAQFNIRYITNRSRPKDNILENNSSAVEEARDFLRFIITKSNLEFMKDRDTPSTFFTVLLESTRLSRDGVGYRLRELTNQNLDGYFDTGRLLFRKVVT